MSEVRSDADVPRTGTPYEPPKVINLGTVLEITERGGSGTSESLAGSPGI